MLSYVIKAMAIMCFALGSKSIFAQNRPTSLNELLNHVEEISPEIQAARSRFDVTKQSLTQASQYLNPDISFGNWRGRAASQAWKQTDITITQPLELGGKRGNRIKVAESQIKQGTVELSALVAQTRLRALFTLYRVRQLKDEINLLREAKETFSHLADNYRKRPQLSPEQRTSLFNFELAYNDYELNLEDALAEYYLLESDVKLLTGYTIDEVLGVLPPRKKTWPELNSAKEIDSPTMRIFSAQAELAESELKLAKSDVWPTLNIGPSYTMQNQFGDRANILGVVVSFPIPVFNQNDGFKAIASKNISAARKQFLIEKSVQEMRREALVKTYQSSSKVLASQAEKESFQKNHKQIESNFLNGLITSPLVLDSHRQMVENQRLYHLREIKTIDAYYQIILLEGGKVEGI